MMSSVVGNCLSDEKNFKTSIASTPTEWVATMLPLKKDMKQMFQKIILHFNKQKSMVSSRSSSTSTSRSRWYRRWNS